MRLMIDLANGNMKHDGTRQPFESFYSPGTSTKSEEKLMSSEFVLALISVSCHFCSVSTSLTRFFALFPLEALVSASNLVDTILSSSAIRRITWDLLELGAKPRTVADRIKRVVIRSIMCLNESINGGNRTGGG